MSCRLSQIDAFGDHEDLKVLVLPRRLDLECVEHLSLKVDLNDLGGATLILDLSQTDYIDSAGIAWLSSTSHRLRSLGSQVQVTGFSNDLLHILEFSGYGHDFFNLPFDFPSQI